MKPTLYVLVLNSVPFCYFSQENAFDQYRLYGKMDINSYFIGNLQNIVYSKPMGLIVSPSEP